MANPRVNTRLAVADIREVTKMKEPQVLNDLANRLRECMAAPSLYHQESGNDIPPFASAVFFEAIAIGDVPIINPKAEGPKTSRADWSMPDNPGGRPISEFGFYGPQLIALLSYGSGKVSPFSSQHITKLADRWRYGRQGTKKGRPCTQDEQLDKIEQAADTFLSRHKQERNKWTAEYIMRQAEFKRLLTEAFGVEVEYGFKPGRSKDPEDITVYLSKRLVQRAITAAKTS